MKAEASRADRFYRLSAGLLLLGFAVAVLWIVRAAPPDGLARISTVRLGWFLLVGALTATCLIARFFRWHFLLRRAGVLVPIRGSLSVYGVSLVGIATPAYVGEALRSVLLRRRFGWPLRATLPIVVLDRLFDVGAIALLGAAVAEAPRTRVLFLSMAAVSIAVVWAADGVVRLLGGSSVVLQRLRQVDVIAPALLMSVLAWTAGGWTIAAAAESLSLRVPLARAMEVFSSATLLGGMTLMPAGVGATGSIAIVRLGNLGMSLADAVLTVSVFRLGTTGLTLLAGLAALTYQLGVRRKRRRTDGPGHFDEIAEEYLDQFSPHMWEHLLERRVEFLASSLRFVQSTNALGLDLGCGVGAQSSAMAERGFRIVGVDPARKLLQAARRSGVACAAADGAALPFHDRSLDYVFTVGVLHHLAGPDAQAAVCREVQRVLRPGGVFVVQETNPRNPLFRVYMTYLFPLLKSIDEGTEQWIEPERWENAPGFELMDTTFFTFLPDFAPRFALPALRAIEGRFERGPWKSQSVHYQVVLRKREEGFGFSEVLKERPTS